MRGLRTAWLSAGLAAALLTVGCGSKPQPQAGDADKGTDQSVAAAAPNACDVLTEAIAKKYLGDGAQLRRKAQPNPRVSQCQWGSDHGVITVEVGQWDSISMKTADDKVESGLGDEAFSNATGLYVRKGAIGLDINIIVASGEFWGSAADAIEAQTLAAERKVAPDLVAKL
jgi:hypothetical protein